MQGTLYSRQTSCYEPQCNAMEHCIPGGPAVNISKCIKNCGDKKEKGMEVGMSFINTSNSKNFYI